MSKLTKLEETMSNNGPSRRNFLRGAAASTALVAGTAAQAGTPDPLITEVQPWASGLGDGVDATPYGLPIEHEADVIRRNVEWLTADTISSINFTPIHALDGTITPQGCAFERHHSGAIELTKSDYRLMINGLVDRPLVFSYADLERFPRENHVYFCECAANTGMEWAGAQLNGAQFTHGMMGADASSNGRSIPMEKALDDVLVAFKANGEALRKEHGYPVRLVVPGWEGNMWVKWIRRIEVMDGPVESREETSKYTDTLEDGTSRKWTWEMDAKSVVTSPSPQSPITHGRGPLVITGLAWSGRGSITRVDVSKDGGMTWETARLAKPGEKMALTRFYLACHGDFAEGVDNWPKLAGGWDTLADKDPLKTVGSYWPHLSTAWDYIYRSMPFGDAQSLEPDEVYAMVAYILYSNDLVDDDFVLSDENFAEFEMPNAAGFIIDDRVETEFSQWVGEPCMENCKDAVEVTMRAMVLDVTPEEEGAEPAAAAVAEVEPAPVVEVVEVAAVDPELVKAGEKVFKKCKSCHQLGEGAKRPLPPTSRASLNETTSLSPCCSGRALCGWGGMGGPNWRCGCRGQGVL